jgi:phosphatidylserine synthase
VYLGIWVGAIIIFTGLMGIISCKEGTQFSLIVFNISCWITMLFSLFLILSSILHIEPYNVNFLRSAQFRVPAQNLEIAMNSLLIGMGSIAFLISLLGAILSCKIAGCCFNRRRRIIKNVPAYPTTTTAQGAPYSIPLNVNNPYSNL